MSRISRRIRGAAVEIPIPAVETSSPIQGVPPLRAYKTYTGME